METFGILSILENEIYKRIKLIWKLIETDYHAKGVQIFNHPNITFQNGKTEKLLQLTKDLQISLLPKLTPFSIEVIGIGHFNKKSIYLEIDKTPRLVEINKLINGFTQPYCLQTISFYRSEKWIPHITLAMDDIDENTFSNLLEQIKQNNIRFTQELHNLCLVKLYSDRSVRIIRKYVL